MMLYKNSARIALDKSETYGPMPIYHENLIDFMSITSYNSEETVIPSYSSYSTGIWICLKGSLCQNESVYANKFDVIGD